MLRFERTPASYALIEKFSKQKYTYLRFAPNSLVVSGHIQFATLRFPVRGANLDPFSSPRQQVRSHRPIHTCWPVARI